MTNEKRLLSGNEAVALGALEAGALVGTAEQEALIQAITDRVMQTLNKR